MCHFASVVSLGVESDNRVFVLLLFLGVILSIRSFFTVCVNKNIPCSNNILVLSTALCCICVHSVMYTAHSRLKHIKCLNMI